MVYLGDCATVYLAIVPLCLLAIVPLCLGNCAIVTLELGYCDSGSLSKCDSGSLGYCDSGVGTIVYSGNWASATLWKYLCINSRFGTSCILCNGFLIEAKIWYKTTLQVNPPSKEKGSSQRDKIQETIKFVKEDKYNRQHWVAFSRIDN